MQNMNAVIIKMLCYDIFKEIQGLKAFYSHFAGVAQIIFQNYDKNEIYIKFFCDLLKVQF